MHTVRAKGSSSSPHTRATPFVVVEFLPRACCALHVILPPLHGLGDLPVRSQLQTSKV
ncbi:hypothetical protein BT93_H3847 [Corymbia citriodora subsp. variegata]|nr:hypothetical protein BT93_H3847 [Corymbia citriodora subsp. variegata]